MNALLKYYFNCAIDNLYCRGL